MFSETIRTDQYLDHLVQWSQKLRLDIWNKMLKLKTSTTDNLFSYHLSYGILYCHFCIHKYAKWAKQSVKVPR